MKTADGVPFVDLSTAPANVQAAFRLVLELLEATQSRLERLEQLTGSFVLQLEQLEGAGDATRERVDSIVDHYITRNTFHALDDQVSTLEYRLTDTSHAVDRLEQTTGQLARLEDRVQALEWVARSR